MLRNAAVGINYLHSLQPRIIHRDLKPSNLLVHRPSFLSSLPPHLSMLMIHQSTKHHNFMRPGGRELEPQAR
jgi:serine/threonine protein kinase